MGQDVKPAKLPALHSILEHLLMCILLMFPGAMNETFSDGGTSPDTFRG